MNPLDELIQEGDTVVARRDIDTEGGRIKAGERHEALVLSAASHFLLLRGFSGYLRKIDFRKVAP